MIRYSKGKHKNKNNPVNEALKRNSTEEQSTYFHKWRLKITTMQYWFAFEQYHNCIILIKYWPPKFRNQIWTKVHNAEPHQHLYQSFDINFPLNIKYYCYVLHTWSVIKTISMCYTWNYYYNIMVYTAMVGLTATSCTRHEVTSCSGHSQVSPDVLLYSPWCISWVRGRRRLPWGGGRCSPGGSRRAGSSSLPPPPADSRWTSRDPGHLTQPNKQFQTSTEDTLVSYCFLM